MRKPFTRIPVLAVGLLVLLGTGDAWSQSKKKKDSNAKEAKAVNSASSVAPGVETRRELPLDLTGQSDITLNAAAGASSSSAKSSRKSKKKSYKGSFQWQLDQKKKAFEERKKKLIKEERKENRLKRKPQYSDPSYFGHKKKPKKRRPGKRKLCKECLIVH